MTSKLPWVAAAIIIVAVAIGAWTIFGGAPAVPAPKPGPAPAPGPGASRVQIVPGAVFGWGAGSPYSGIIAVHIMKHNTASAYYYNTGENLYSHDNALANIYAGSGVDNENTIPYDTRFDVVIEVQGHDDNMGQVNKAYLQVELNIRKDTAWNPAAENSTDSDTGVGGENAYISTSAKVNVNAKWDNAGNGYILSADDNLLFESIKLWLRG